MDTRMDGVGDGGTGRGTGGLGKGGLIVRKTYKRYPGIGNAVDNIVVTFPLHIPWKRIP